MKGSQKIIAVCAANIHTDDVQSIIYPLHRAISARGWKDIVFGTLTDLYEQTAFNYGEASVFRLVDPDTVDAVIILANTIKNERYISDLVKRAEESSIPVIAVDDNMVRSGCINVNFDENDAFYRLVEHLVEKHHFTKINCIAGMKDNPISENRVNIYKQVLERHNIPFEEKRFGYGDFYSFPTEKVMKRFLEDPEGLPQAIVCINDSMAITACEILEAHGINVPSQVAVVGFDGIEQEKYNFPRISTCRRNMDKLSELLTDIAGKAMNGDKMQELYLFPYEPDFSESCGCREVSVGGINRSINILCRRINDDTGIERSMNNMVAKLTCKINVEEIRKILKYYMRSNSYICVNSDFYEYGTEGHIYDNEPFAEEMICSKYFYGLDTVTISSSERSSIIPDLDEFLRINEPPVIFCVHNQQEVYGYLISYTADYSPEGFSDSIRTTQRFVSALNNCISMHVQQTNLQISNFRLQEIQNKIITSFADMVESRDKFTGKHVKRTGEYLKVFADHLSTLPRYSSVLTDEYRELMCKAAPLHDIGKIKISDNILNKPGRLTEDEFDIIKTHTVEGAKIIDITLTDIEDSDYIETAEEMAMYHHEKWNGMGYPHGLSGESIPLCARIMAVVDVFDALTSKRVYKDAFSVNKAIDIVSESSGTHFDPCLAVEFVRIRSRIENVLYDNPD